jgi:hypothetical protein
MPGSPEWYRYQHELATGKKEHGAADQSASVVSSSRDRVCLTPRPGDETTGGRLRAPMSASSNMDRLGAEGLKLIPTFWQ